MEVSPAEPIGAAVPSRPARVHRGSLMIAQPSRSGSGPIAVHFRFWFWIWFGSGSAFGGSAGSGRLARQGLRCARRI